MDIDIFSLLVGAGIFLLGIIITAFSEVIRDMVSEPYHRWKDKRDTRRENIETLRSHIDDFCSTWELFKCKSIPSVDLEKDMINACRESYGLISKNESDFQKSNVGRPIKEVCKRFISLHPQNEDIPGWTRGAENQIDEICEEFRKYNKMLEKK